MQRDLNQTATDGCNGDKSEYSNYIIIAASLNQFGSPLGCTARFYNKTDYCSDAITYTVNGAYAVVMTSIILSRLSFCFCMSDFCKVLPRDIPNPNGFVVCLIIIGI